MEVVLPGELGHVLVRRHAGGLESLGGELLFLVGDLGQPRADVINKRGRCLESSVWSIVDKKIMKCHVFIFSSFSPAVLRRSRHAMPWKRNTVRASTPACNTLMLNCSGYRESFTTRRDGRDDNGESSGLHPRISIQTLQVHLPIGNALWPSWPKGLQGRPCLGGIYVYHKWGHHDVLSLTTIINSWGDKTPQKSGPNATLGNVRPSCKGRLHPLLQATYGAPTT